MIDVSELMFDPDFASPYIVIRKTGKWLKGRYVTTEKRLNYQYPVQPAKTKDLEQLPEGDRVKGVMKFFCAPPDKLYMSTVSNTTEASGGYISDELEYQGARYKIIQISPWDANGYVRAFAIKTS